MVAKNGEKGEIGHVTLSQHLYSEFVHVDIATLLMVPYKHIPGLPVNLP